MKARSKIPFVDGGRTVPRIKYAVAHLGLLLGFCKDGETFGEAARRLATMYGKNLKGDFEIWIDSHWERHGQGFRSYKPMMTVNI